MFANKQFPGPSHREKIQLGGRGGGAGLNGVDVSYVLQTRTDVVRAVLADVKCASEHETIEGAGESGNGACYSYEYSCLKVKIEFEMWKFQDSFQRPSSATGTTQATTNVMVLTGTEDKRKSNTFVQSDESSHAAVRRPGSATLTANAPTTTTNVMAPKQNLDLRLRMAPSSL